MITENNEMLTHIQSWFPHLWSGKMWHSTGLATTFTYTFLIVLHNACMKTVQVSVCTLYNWCFYRTDVCTFHQLRIEQMWHSTGLATTFTYTFLIVLHNACMKTVQVSVCTLYNWCFYRTDVCTFHQLRIEQLFHELAIV